MIPPFDQSPAPAPAPAVDPAPAHPIPYTMFTQEPIRTPGGGLTMPPLPPEALTREASDDRLNYVSARAELILVNWVDRLAVFGVSAPMDIDRFERATMSLWRLTAIRKSINALQDSPGSPPDPSLFPSLPTAPFSDSSAAILPASSSLGPRTASSADAPVSNTAISSSTTPTTDSAPHPPGSAGFLPASPSPRSALATPHLSSLPALPSLSVRAVPACPTLTPEGIATFLSRTESDLAEATRRTPPILDPPPTSHNPHPSHPPFSPHSFSPHFALHTPHSADLRAPP